MQGTVVYIRDSDIFNDSRALKEISALAKHGYEVHALGWNRSGKADEECREIFKEGEVKFSFFQVNLQKGIGFKNIFKLFGFFRWVFLELKRMEKEIDFVHACDLSTGISACKFCKKYKKKLIYDIFDYYIDSHSVPKIARWFVERKEIKIINKASATIICTEERKEQISKAKPKRLFVIHNSPNIEDGSTISPEYDYVYCGVFNQVRLIEEILNEYQNHTNFTIKMVGNGRLLEKVKKNHDMFANFEYLGVLAYDKVLELESRAKVISAIYKPTLRNHKLCAPNKFYEAMALGKPLIVCRGTGIDKIVEENNIGIVIDYSAEQFFEALQTLTSNPIMCQEIGERLRALYKKHYKWSIMEQRLLQLYQDVREVETEKL